MALEVLSVESVGSCYMLQMRDARGDLIKASFHAATKDRIT